MKILITNDDGIMAPGIQVLAKKMTQLGEVIIVAPNEEKSATGHGITVWDPIRVREMTFTGIQKAWAVSGTPVDCVKLALQELVCGECGLLISGINNGPNLGTDVLYSGTVSAAIEGSILGIPSLAVSLASFTDYEYDLAAEIALSLARKIWRQKEIMPAGTLLNINVPPVKKEELRGFKITRLGVREYENVFDKRLDPRGNIYFWLKGDPVPQLEQDPEIDVVAVEQNYVSISPIHFDLTNHRVMEQFKEYGFEETKLV